MPPHADILQWEHLPFPKSLRDFQRLFPDDDACARWLEGAKWPKGFVCPHCSEKSEPFRMATRKAVLTCRSCRKQTSLTVGTVMQRTHSPLTTWFWGAYLVATMTPGISTVQFERQLGLTRETAFQILHKLRAGMVRQNRDRIGGNLSRNDHVEIDETYIGGVVRGQGRGPQDQSLVMAAVEVRQRPAKKGDKPMRRGGRYAGRLRLEIVPNRGAKALTAFVEQAVEPGAMVITDAWGGYNSLSKLGYQHLPVVEGNDPNVAEEYLPIVHLVFSNLKAWLQGTHHGRVSPKHLQAYLNEFVFRFNRRFYPFNSFRSLLGIGANGEGPTYDGLYEGTWKHPGPVCGNPKSRKSFKGEYVIVDGLQRLTAARRFMSNEIRAFGSYLKDYEDGFRLMSVDFIVCVNNLKTRAAVLRWYLEMNTGGTPHSADEILRVTKMYEDAIKKAA